MQTAIALRAIDEQVRQGAMKAGYTPFQADLIAARVTREDVAKAGGVRELIAPTLGQLDSPGSLPDIDKATARIAHAIDAGEVIALCTDHDADGVTAHAVLRLGLVEYLLVRESRVQSYTTDKLTEGYGVSDAFVDRLLGQAVRPALLITADQGSGDEPRIARLRAAGIETIVTDHHGIPASGPPTSAIATVSPTRSDSAFPDPFIAGCHVAWLLIAALRAHRIAAGHAVVDKPIAQLLDIVALGTVCDCVSLARSVNNRAVIRAALRRIAVQPRPAWTALNQAAGKDPAEPVTEATLGWVWGPRCNASGRVASAMPGVHLLLAGSERQALGYARVLEDNNTERKAIQKGMVAQADELADALIQTGDPVLLVWLPEGHSGVQGIVAAHLVRRTGRAVICLTHPPRAEDLLSGSMRSLPGVHAKALLDAVAREQPGLLIKHGGHAGAAGLTVRARDFDRLRAAVTRAFAVIGAVSGQVDHQVDVAPPRPPSLDLLEEIEAVGPFGMDYPQPTFGQVFQIKAARAMGDGTHLRLQIERDGCAHEAVWFGGASKVPELPCRARVVYRLARNVWRGRARVDIQIEDVALEDGHDSHRDAPGAAADGRAVSRACRPG